jgi:putative spermidine/putrescine transport system permease protein
MRGARRHFVLGVFCALGCAFILAPLLIIIVSSFSSVAFNVFPPPGWSTRWYANMLAQSSFGLAAVRSVVLGLLVTALSLVIGTMASYALMRHRLPGAGLIRAFVMAPVVVPKIVLGVAVFMFFVRLGVASDYSSLLLTHTLVSFPFVVAVVSAALANFDWSLEEAARDLGAGRLTAFRRVLVPEIRVSLLIGAVFAFMTSFDQVETTLFLVRPGENTLPIEMFLYLQKWQDPTIAALSVVLILFAAILVVVLSAALRNRQQAIGLLRRQDGMDMSEGTT